MRDILPAQMSRRLAVINSIMDAYRQYGYEVIETPALESLRFLQSGDGGDNEKLMYRVMKRGLTEDSLSAAASPDDLADLGLRYDLTVPLARFFASNRAQLPTPFRAIQIGPVWRAERPQRGRYRQFTQCDIDILGEPGIAAEVELVRATVRALASIGIADGTLRINDRRILIDLMTSCGFAPEDVPAALIQVDKIDKIGVDGVHEQVAQRWNRDRADAVRELLTAFADPDIRRNVVANHMQSEEGQLGLAAIDETTRLLTAAGGITPLQLSFDPTLVRGMGYYTGTIFEVTHPAAAGSIAGGGRYDEMIGRISGTATPACGFSIGFERIMELLDETPIPVRETTALLHAPADLERAIIYAEQMRAQGDRVLTVVRVKNRRAQLERLAAQGIHHIVDLPDTPS